MKLKLSSCSAWQFFIFFHFLHLWPSFSISPFSGYTGFSILEVGTELNTANKTAKLTAIHCALSWALGGLIAFTSPHTRHNACSHPHLMDEERERASFALDTSWSLRWCDHQKTHPTTVCQATLGWVIAVPVIAWFPVFGRPSKDSVQPHQMHDLLARCPPSESGRSSATWQWFRTNQDWGTIASP